IGALILISVNPEHNVAAGLMAALALASVWIVAAAPSQTGYWSGLKDALSGVKRGQAPNAAPEDAPRAIQKAWEDVEVLYDELMALRARIGDHAGTAGVDGAQSERLRSVEQELSDALASLDAVCSRQQAAGAAAQKCIEEMTTALGGIAERT